MASGCAHFAAGERQARRNTGREGDATAQPGEVPTLIRPWTFLFVLLAFSVLYLASYLVIVQMMGEFETIPAVDQFGNANMI